MTTINRELRQAIERGDAVELGVCGCAIPLRGMLDPRQDAHDAVRVRIKLDAGPVIYQTLMYHQIVYYRLFSKRADGSYRDHFEELRSDAG